VFVHLKGFYGDDDVRQVGCSAVVKLLQTHRLLALTGEMFMRVNTRC